MTQDGEEMRVTFRAEREKVHRLDQLIDLKKGLGELDRETSRSDLLRECVDDLVEELESGDSGNPKTPPIAAD